MRGMLVIAVAIVALAAIIGVAAMRPGQGDPDSVPVSSGATATPLKFELSGPHATGVAVTLPQVAEPELVAPIGPLWRVREYYSEVYTFDTFTVRWHPGAFPPEYAADVAAQGRIALDRANALLGMSDERPIEIMLADRMFDEGCRGCQGFAAADLRQVFILHDGSVEADEFASLLVHEIGHVLALDIALPEKLFFAEGIATWISDADIQGAGYVSPLQTSAWALRAGVLPPLLELRTATYEGRMRARVEYDGAASFAFFCIETYGLDAYKQLYALEAPERVVGKNWIELEGEWHGYLERWADHTVNGVDAVTWWAAAQRVIAGFEVLYDSPEWVSAEQYAALSAARIALNRCQIEQALAFMDAAAVASVPAASARFFG